MFSSFFGRGKGAKEADGSVQSPPGQQQQPVGRLSRSPTAPAGHYNASGGDVSAAEMPPYERCDLCFTDAAAVSNGCRGLPADLSASLYHTPTAMLLVGTVRGGVHAYGCGFQLSTELVPALEARRALPEVEVSSETPATTTDSCGGNAAAAGGGGGGGSSGDEQGWDQAEVLQLFSVSATVVLAWLRCGALLLLDARSLTVVGGLSRGELVRIADLPSSNSGSSTHVSAVHVDSDAGKPFVYVGFSCGAVAVLDATATAAAAAAAADGDEQYQIELRVCDFSVSQLVAGQAVTALAVCPKDERYLAVAQAGGSDGCGGCVIIYDVRTHKQHRRYPTGSCPEQLQWSHTGDVLFAALGNGSGGTGASREVSHMGCSGDVLALELEKAGCAVVWAASAEATEEDDDDDDDDGGGGSGDGDRQPGEPSVRGLGWLAPQSDTDPSRGCLLVLVGYGGAEVGSISYSNKSVSKGSGGYGGRGEHNKQQQPRSAVVVLELAGGNESGSSGDVALEELLTVPPVAGEEALAMLLVPVTPFGRGSGGEEEQQQQAQLALLLLLQDIPFGERHVEIAEEVNGDDEQQTQRQPHPRRLRLFPCPKEPYANWPLEVGTLPDARRVGELLPCRANCAAGGRGESASDVSAVALLSVPTPAADGDGNGATVAGLLVGAPSAVSAGREPQLVLARLPAAAASSVPAASDVVVAGHSDGSVSAYAVRYQRNSAGGVGSSTRAVSVWSTVRHWPAHRKEAGMVAASKSMKQTDNMAGGRLDITCIASADATAAAAGGMLGWADAAGNVTVYALRSGRGGSEDVLCLSAMVPGAAAVTALALVPVEGRMVAVVGTRNGELFLGACDAAAGTTVGAGTTNQDENEDESDNGLVPSVGTLLPVTEMSPLSGAGAVTALWVEPPQQGQLQQHLFLVLANGQLAVLALSAATATAAAAKLVSFGTKPPPHAPETGETRWENANLTASPTGSTPSAFPLGLHDAAGRPVSIMSAAAFFVAALGRCMLSWELSSLVPAHQHIVFSPPPTRTVRQRVCYSLITSATLGEVSVAGCSCDSAHVLLATSSGSAGVVSLAPLLRGAAAQTTPSCLVNLLEAHMGPFSPAAAAAANAAGGSRGSWAHTRESVHAVVGPRGHVYTTCNGGKLLRQATLAGDNFHLKDASKSGRRASASAVGATVVAAAAAAAAATTTLSVDTACLPTLRSGREARLAKVAKKVEKRRSSILGSFSLKDPPTVLADVYARTRTRTSSAAEMLIEEGDEDDDDDDEGASASARNGGHSDAYVKQQSAAAFGAMAEARQNLEKRGQALEKLSARGESFQSDSMDFKKSAADHRRALEEKQKRWGLF